MLLTPGVRLVLNHIAEGFAHQHVLIEENGGPNDVAYEMQRKDDIIQTVTVIHKIVPDYPVDEFYAKAHYGSTPPFHQKASDASIRDMPAVIYVTPAGFCCSCGATASAAAGGQARREAEAHAEKHCSTYAEPESPIRIVDYRMRQHA